MKKLFNTMMAAVFICLCFACSTVAENKTPVPLQQEAAEKNVEIKADSFVEKDKQESEIGTTAAEHHDALNRDVTDSESDTIIFQNQNTLVIKERSDYRTYINGKYSGLTYRESETYLQRQPAENAEKFSGQTFVVQDTRRNMVSQVKKVDEVRPVSFTKRAGSGDIFFVDNGFPLLRSFFDSLNQDYAKLAVGTYWDDTAAVSIFPLKEKGAVMFPVIVRYEYAGHANYLGEDVYKVKAKYALRNEAPQTFKAVNGSRDMEIFISVKTNAVIFVREKTLEQFTYTDGITVKNDGTLLHFLNYTAARKKITVNADNTVKSIETQTKGVEKAAAKIEFEKSKNYTVEHTDLGLKLRLENLRFVADKDTLLAGEDVKLDEIAAVLKKFPDKKFFVEGHTASTGQPVDEKKLSEARAFVVVSELIKRGIAENKFLYSGAGASKPLASNNTPQGMAQNRRVEITVLEQ